MPTGSGSSGVASLLSSTGLLLEDAAPAATIAAGWEVLMEAQAGRYCRLCPLLLAAWLPMASDVSSRLGATFASVSMAKWTEAASKCEGHASIAAELLVSWRSIAECSAGVPSPQHRDV